MLVGIAILCFCYAPLLILLRSPPTREEKKVGGDVDVSIGGNADAAVGKVAAGGQHKFGANNGNGGGIDNPAIVSDVVGAEYNTKF